MSDKQPFDLKEDYGTKYGFHDPENYVFKAKPGLSRRGVEEISWMKKEPAWMTEFRLKAYEIFLAKPMPTWGNCDLINQIRFDDIYYYMKPSERSEKSWDDVPENIKKTFEKLGIPEAERKFLAGVTAQYECLAGDTLVHTAEGPREIARIEPGMRVWSLDEANKRLVLQKVRARMPKGRRSVFRVGISGRTLRCTANHPFLALTYTKEPGRRRGRFGTQWKYLEELKPGDYVAVAKRIPERGRSQPLPAGSWVSRFKGGNQLGAFPVETEALFDRRQKTLRLPRRSSEELLWFLGAYIGDGFVHRSTKGGEKNVLAVAYPASAPALRERLIRAVEAVFGYRIVANGDPYRLRIHSVPIVRWMTGLGLDAGAKTKSVPEFVFRGTREERLAFIGGYIDSDGHLRSGPRNCDVVLTSANPRLLRQVQNMALGLGLGAGGPYEFVSKAPYKGQMIARKAYRLTLSGDLSPLMPHSEKCSGFVPRAYSHTRNTGPNDSPLDKWTSEDMGFARIREIEPAGTEEVFDIEVEGFHNFVAEGVIVHNSEAVYHQVNKELTKKGVIFTDMDTALREHPDLVKRYFATVIPPTDNKFAALNSAVWSGGSFIYVPKGQKVDLPLQAYFRINAARAGQFERTLILADEGSSVHYIEGCTAPNYSEDALHSAVVELIAMPGAHIRYTTIQNWADNVFNLVTKRAMAQRDAFVEWVDGNIGSKLTMKFPAVYLVGKGARADILSCAFAGKNQHQDTGGKLIFAAPHTSGTIVSKSVSKDGGRASYRGLVKAYPRAHDVKVNVRCDALLLDEHSRSDTYPTMEIDGRRVQIGHEASVSKIGDEQLFYLRSRGLSETDAVSMIVNGFFEAFTKELPLEYAVELNRLIQLSMEGSVG